MSCKCISELERAVESIARTQGHFEDLIEHTEEGIEKLFDRIEKIEMFMASKELKPYKCPICNGDGKISKQIFAVQCNPCEGKGIVWK